MPGEVVQFVIWALLALYVITVIHELAHAAAGALTGLHVAACGIGYSKPLIRFRLFGILFYQTRSPFGGLTLVYNERIFETTRATTYMIAAGPIADSLVTLTLFGLWYSGVDQPWVRPTLYMALFVLGMDAVPFSFRVGGATLQNDARLLLDRFRGRAFDESTSPGEQLRSSLYLCGFFQKLDVWQGAVHYTLNAAFYQAMLLDHEGARATLQHECLKDPRRGDFLSALEAYARAWIAVVAETQDAKVEIAAAASLCGDSPGAQAALKLMEAQLAVARGNPSAPLIREAIELALHARMEQAAVGAELLRLEAEPPEHPLEASRRLQESVRRIGNSPLQRLALAAVTTRQLAEAGRFEEARAPFHEALALIREIAATIPLDETRQRFVARASKPLQESVLKSADAEVPPIYLSTDAIPAAKQRSARGLAWAGLIAAGVLIGLLVVILQEMREPMPDFASMPDFDLGSVAIQRDAAQRSEEMHVLVDVLRGLRSGDREQALERLEDRLDQSVVHLAHVSEVSRDRVPAWTVEALRAARGYRDSYPRQTGSSDVDSRLNAALSLAIQAEPRSDEPVITSPQPVVSGPPQSLHKGTASSPTGR